MRDKKKLTQTLVSQLDPELGIDVDWAYSHWWHNLRPQGGMRLTKIGHETFVKLLKLEHYKFQLDPFEINSKVILDMDRRLQTPYFVRTHKQIPVEIVFFGSREAVMANLYGDIKKFIDNYRP